MIPFLYFGHTEISRVCFGVEFIGGNGKYGIMFSLFWWFIITGIERREIICSQNNTTK